MARMPWESHEPIHMICPLTKQEFDRAYGSKTGDSNYDPRADMNKDGVVNFDDFTMFAACLPPTTTPAEPIEPIDAPLLRPTMPISEPRVPAEPVEPIDSPLVLPTMPIIPPRCPECEPPIVTVIKPLKIYGVDAGIVFGTFIGLFIAIILKEI